MSVVVDDALLWDLWAWEDAWAAAGFDASQWLAPGLPAGRVAGTLVAEGLPPAAGVVAWFSWHDGPARGRRAVDLAPSRHRALSLEAALGLRRDLLHDAAGLAEQLAGDPVAEPAQFWWEPGWLPLGDDGGGGTLAVELREGAAGTGPVHDVNWEEVGSRAPVALDLAEMVHLWVRAAASGKWRWDDAARRWDWEQTTLPDYLAHPGLS